MGFALIRIDINYVATEINYGHHMSRYLTLKINKKKNKTSQTLN